MSKKYITEIIKNEYEQWKNGDIIFINSGTGTGKSHFVRNELTELAMKERSEILFIFNRSKLEKQNQETLYNEFNFMITTETYQNIEYKINTLGEYDFSRFKYIVCDEYHYFTEDSTFNDNSDKSFNAIMALNNHVRIFMSATGHTIYNFIKSTYGPKLIKNGNKLWAYNLKPDFSNIVSLSFYKDTEVVQKFIEDKFPAETDKILWFCRSIKQAEKLHKKYSNSSFMCSNSSANKKYFRYLSDDTFIKANGKTMFKGKFLFTTKVLDNGFDLFDENLKVIVCDYFDITTILQCIGRKRMLNEADKVNIVLINYSNQSLGGMHSELKQTMREAEAFLESTEKWLEVVGRYARKSNYIIFDTVNEKKHGSDKDISKPKYLKVKCDLETVRQILEDNKYLNQFREDTGQKRVNDAFMQFIMKELNKGKCRLLDDIYGIEDLGSYLESLVGKKLFKEGQRELIDRMDVRANGRQIKSYSAFNKIFVEWELKYVIDAQQEKKRVLDDGGKNPDYNKTYWIIYRITK